MKPVRFDSHDLSLDVYRTCWQWMRIHNKQKNLEFPSPLVLTHELVWLPTDAITDNAIIVLWYECLCPFSNSYRESLMRWHQEGGPSVRVSYALKVEPPWLDYVLLGRELALCLGHVRTKQEDGHLQTRNLLSPWPGGVSTLILDFWASKNAKNKCSLFKLLSLWYLRSQN